MAEPEPTASADSGGGATKRRRSPGPKSGSPRAAASKQAPGGKQVQRGSAAAPKRASAAAPNRGRAPKTKAGSIARASAVKGAPVTSAPAGGPDPAPGDVIGIDGPPPGLPDLTFPSSPGLEASELKAARRSRRLRIELIGGGVLVVVSALTAVATGSPAILLLLVLALATVVAYELLVTSLE